MAKSFKDYYTVDKDEEARPRKKAQVEPVAVTRTPEVQSQVAEQVQPKLVIAEDISKAVREVMVEQRLQSESLLESVTKVNQEISANVSKLVESTNELNTRLLEAISTLSERVLTLEGKLDEIKHLEIPTPIVNLQMPSKRTVKKVHRDAKGVITHIEESEQFDTDEDKEEE